MAKTKHNKTHDVMWTSEIETITPSYAADVIRAYEAAVKKDPSKKNRNVNHNRVVDYAKAMIDHKWLANGETIKFDEDGILVDGQHRLMACARSNVPFQTLIVYNVPRNTFDTIDVGNIRTATQVIRMSGVKYASNVSAIINGLKNFMVSMPENGVYAMKSRYQAREMREVYESNPAGFNEAAEFASKYNRTGVLSQKLIGVLYYYLVYTMKQDSDMVSEFLINITFDDSVPNAIENNLRKRLFALKGCPAPYDRVRLAMIARTWNALAENQTKIKLPDCNSQKNIKLSMEVPQFISRS